MTDGTVVLRLLELTMERLVELGCDARALEARVPLPRGTPWSHAPFSLLPDLVEAGLELLDEPNLGLRLRLPFDARKGGLLVLLMLACPDVRSAARRLERYQRIAFDAHRVVVEDDATLLVAIVPGPERPASRHLREWMLADALGGIETMTGAPATPLEVTFPHARPEGAPELERFFRCTIRFDAPRATLRFSDEVVSRPLRHANEIFREAFEEQALSLIAALPSRTRWVERVRAVILEGLPETASIDLVASRLRTSPRTLQRRLADEGSSVHDVLSDVRRTEAARHLAEGREVAEVSYLLGYATPTSFHRAFRAWYDTTPAAYRERARR